MKNRKLIIKLSKLEEKLQNYKNKVFKIEEEILNINKNYKITPSELKQRIKGIEDAILECQFKYVLGNKEDGFRTTMMINHNHLIYHLNEMKESLALEFSPDLKQQIIGLSSAILICERKITINKKNKWGFGYEKKSTTFKMNINHPTISTYLKQMKESLNKMTEINIK
jgi:hypothetical protein